MPEAITEKPKPKRGPYRRWTELQEKFCLAYADPNSPSCGVALRSARIAGYGGSHVDVTACQLMKHPRILRRIEELKKDFGQRAALQNAVTLSLVQKEHARLAALAEGQGDLTNATRNLEALGRTIGAYSDSVRVDIAKVREYTAQEQAEAKRLASIRLTELIALAPVPASLPVADAKAEAARRIQVAIQPIQDTSSPQIVDPGALQRLPGASQQTEDEQKSQEGPPATPQPAGSPNCTIPSAM
jgi:phage terminase small subunit